MKLALNHFVMHELCCDSATDPDDHAYHPTPTYIKNHIQKAKCLLKLSKLDQENPGLTCNSISGLTKEKSWRNNDRGN